MHIEFRKFVQLTAMIASGMAMLPACTVEDTKDSGTGGGGQSAAGQSNAGDAGKAGEAESSAGAAGDDEGSAGAAGNPSSEGGAAGSPSSEGGAAGSPSSEGGAAGSPSSEGGAAGSPSSEGGAAGSPSSEGGAAGSPSSEGGAAGSPSSEGGAAGSPSSEGGAAGGPSSEGGAAGAAGACMQSDPAGEGDVGIDCSALSYASEECGPTGEGASQAYGVNVCWSYAYSRQESAQYLFDCLNALTAPESGWCGSEHAAQVETCIDNMQTNTCASSAAQTACESINAKCAAVTVADCVADLSVLDDSAATSVDTCVEGYDPSTCAYEYLYYCQSLPSPELDIEPLCEEFVAQCSTSTVEDCMIQLGTRDYYGTGTISQRSLVDLATCARNVERETGLTCDEALVSCGTGV